MKNLANNMLFPSKEGKNPANHGLNSHFIHLFSSIFPVHRFEQKGLYIY